MIAHDLEGNRQEPPLLTPMQIAKILGHIKEHESVFTDKDIARAANLYTSSTQLFAKAITEIKSSPDLIFLGAGDDGRERFTTRTMFDLENELQKTAEQLGKTTHIKLSDTNIDKTLTTYERKTGKTLTEEQLLAVKHILQSSAISCVVGRAGTGKSFSLGAAKAVWESAGLKVLGVALSGIAADGLEKDANIDSRTIESFRLALTTGTLQLTPQHVVVMDEAGMTDSLSMTSVLTAVKKVGAKLVLVGDHAQIQPVGPGASFRAIVERLGFAEIQTVYRQNEAWQREATHAFSSGKVAAAMNAYSQRSCVHLSANAELSIAKLVDDWFATRAQNQLTLSELLVVAHRNEDVALLNQCIRTSRFNQGEIGVGIEVNTTRGTLNISEGDRLLFTKNDRTLGVSNGRFATIQSIQLNSHGEIAHFKVILDGSNKEININPTQYRDFTLGYAATVHKVQGMTVDHAFVYAGGYSWNRHLTYVAMTRHRKSCHLYANQEIHKNAQSLIKNLSKIGIKDSLLDYPLAFAERRSIDTEPLLKRLSAHLAKRLNAFKEQLRETIYQDFAHTSVTQAISETTTHEQQKNREDARLVARYVDDSQAVGKAWQALQQKLNDLGLQEMPRETTAFEQLRNTDEYQTLQAISAARNAKAFEMMQVPEPYQKAIELYQLDVKKIKSHAAQHARLLDIKAYQKAHQDGLVVPRNKIAAKIIIHIKSYYPQIKAMGVDIKVLRTHAIGPDSVIISKMNTLENIVKTFVEMEIKQSALVREMHSCEITDNGRQLKKELSAQVIQHSKEIGAFAINAINHPNVKRELALMKGLKPASLTELGGYASIYERMVKGEFSHQDVKTVLRKIYSKAQALSRSESQDRSRGGRSV